MLGPQGHVCSLNKAKNLVEGAEVESSYPLRDLYFHVKQLEQNLSRSSEINFSGYMKPLKHHGEPYQILGA